MDVLSIDSIHIILTFVLDDPRAIHHLARTCKSFYNIIHMHCEPLFQMMLSYRWSSANPSRMVSVSFREEYKDRYCKDMTAKSLLRNVSKDVISKLQYQETVTYLPPDYITLIRDYRSDIKDMMKTIATSPMYRKENQVEQNMFRFFACRVILSLHLQECIEEWNQLRNEGVIVDSDILIERFAILLVKLFMTPEEVVYGSAVEREATIQKELDNMAHQCRKRMANSQSTFDQISILLRVLFVEQEFQGNTEFYDSYENSLLDFILKNKRGIPITLAILVSCVARRLSSGIQFQFIGLPGHLVLGFEDEVRGIQRFVDVFHGGEILELADCHRIVQSYGIPWNDQFLVPMTPIQILHRCLLNLEHCHLPYMDLSRHLLYLFKLATQPNPPISVPRILHTFPESLPFTTPRRLIEMFGFVL